MSKALPIILFAAGAGGIALLARAASAASPQKQQTYVEKTIAAAKASPKIQAAKETVKKGTTEAKAAIDAIEKLLLK